MRLNYSPLVLLTLLAACPDKDPVDTDTSTGTTALTDAGTSTGMVTTTDASATAAATGSSSTDSDGSASSTGATAGSTGAPVDDCAFLVGKTFKSDDELECGLGPNGPVPCQWTLSFTADTYMHQYSDIGESGPYTCEAGVITATDTFMMPITATIDGATGTLVWNDIVYHPAG